jgi:uncharacterized protein Yka (UPF0111/DUF47 family)
MQKSNAAIEKAEKDLQEKVKNTKGQLTNLQKFANVFTLGANQRTADAVAQGKVMKEGQAAIEKMRQDAQKAAEATEDMGESLSQAAEDMSANIAELKSRAESLTQSLRTPLEKYADTINELRSLFKGGFITDETFRRGVADAANTLLDASNHMRQTFRELRGIGAVERNTTAGFSAVHAAMRQSQNQQRWEKAQADELKKQTQLLEDANRMAAQRQNVVLRQATF